MACRVSGVCASISIGVRTVPDRKAEGRPVVSHRSRQAAALWPLHVQHAEGARHNIHTGIRKRDYLGVADTEIDTRVAPDRLGDHARGKINSDDVSATLGCRGGKRASTTGDVQNMNAWCCFDGFEQWIDGAEGDGALTVVLVARLAIPGFQLASRKVCPFIDTVLN